MTEKRLFVVNDQSDAKFTNFSVSPSTGNRRTKFVLDCSFVTKNGTGTGMLRLSLSSPQTQTATTDLLIEAVKPGSYAEKIPVDIFDQNYDSSLGRTLLFVTKHISSFHFLSGQA